MASCTAAWIAWYSEWAVFGAGDTAAEFLSGGTITPAVAVAAIGELGVLAATGTYLIGCLNDAGKPDQAAQMQQQINTLQQEIDKLKQAAGQS